MGAATDLALALDRSAFAIALGVEPDPWQARLLRSTADRILLNCSRQSGKSTVASVMALHRALYHPNSLVLVLGPTLRQSQEFFAKVTNFYRYLGRPVPSHGERKLSLELANGSRVVSLPGTEKTVRGFSGAALLICDEASRVQDDLYYSTRPMLATSGGTLIALSTPYGTRGWWHEAWVGREPWERYEVPATECPRIPSGFLAEERRTLGQWWFEQEYMCRFLDAETQAFRREDVEGAFSEEVEPWRL